MILTNDWDWGWKRLSGEGLLVADYIGKGDSFKRFCELKNRECELFDTRYGVGIAVR